MKYVVRISEFAGNLVEDLCNTYAKLTLAPIGSIEAYDAYAALTMRKKELYEYLASCERACRVPQEARTIETFIEVAHVAPVTVDLQEISPYRPG